MFYETHIVDPIFLLATYQQCFKAAPYVLLLRTELNNSFLLRSSLKKTASYSHYGGGRNWGGGGNNSSGGSNDGGQTPNSPLDSLTGKALARLSKKAPLSGKKNITLASSGLDLANILLIMRHLLVF